MIDFTEEQGLTVARADLARFRDRLRSSPPEATE